MFQFYFGVSLSFGQLLLILLVVGGAGGGAIAAKLPRLLALMRRDEVHTLRGPDEDSIQRDGAG